jgi:hypothetical protein
MQIFIFVDTHSRTMLLPRHINLTRTDLHTVVTATAWRHRRIPLCSSTSGRFLYPLAGSMSLRSVLFPSVCWSGQISARMQGSVPQRHFPTQGCSIELLFTHGKNRLSEICHLRVRYIPSGTGIAQLVQWLATGWMTEVYEFDSW